MADSKDLEIKQGKTYSLVLRWETEPIVYKPITAISLANGAPRLTFASAHGTPNGWRGAVTRVKGMTQINAKNSPPRASDFVTATVIDANTIELNSVTPCDDSGAEWSDYTSGGFWQFNTPVDLAGYTARMKIKDKIGGTVLASTEAGDSPLNILSIAIDKDGKTITLSIAATATDDIAWAKGVYDLEMVSAGGVVTTILSGKVTVTKEVTT